MCLQGQGTPVFLQGLGGVRLCLDVPLEPLGITKVSPFKGVTETVGVPRQVDPISDGGKTNVLVHETFPKTTLQRPSLKNQNVLDTTV